MCGSYEIYKSRRWGDCTFARASTVSLSRKPLSLDIEATQKTDLSVSGSLVHRQTWRVTSLLQPGVNLCRLRCCQYVQYNPVVYLCRLRCSQYVPPRRQVVIDFDVIDRSGLSQLPDSPPRPASSRRPEPEPEAERRMESARRDLARLLSDEPGGSESGQ